MGVVHQNVSRQTTNDAIKQFQNLTQPSSNATCSNMHTHNLHDPTDKIRPTQC